MNTLEKKLEHQVQFWGLIGPLFILATLFVITLKATIIPMTFPAAALIGVVLCWKWKLRGLAISLGFLAAVIVFHFGSIPPEEQLWTIGLTFSIALALLVTALSFEEVESLLKTMHLESASRLDNLLEIDEKLKTMQEQSLTAKEELDSKINILEKELAERNASIDEYRNRIESVQSEFTTAQTQNEKLNAEVSKTRQETAALQEKLEEAEETLKVLSCTQFIDPQILEDLQARCDQQCAELDTARESLQAALKKMQSYESELDASKQLIESHELQHLQHHDDQIRQQAVVQEMSDHIEMISREKGLLETSLRREAAESYEFKKQMEEDVCKKAIEFNLIQDKLHAANETLEKTSLILKHTQDDYLRQNALVEDLTRDKQLLDKTLTLLRDEVEELKKNTLAAPQVIDGRMLRQIEGKLLQLREQFVEKSMTLDETRRQLFHTEEKLLQLEKEFEETNTYCIDANEQALLLQLAHTQEAWALESQHYQSEVDLLSEIISNLTLPAKPKVNVFSRL